MPLYQRPSSENVRVYERVGYWRRAVEAAQARERRDERREVLAWAFVVGFVVLAVARAAEGWRIGVFDLLTWVVVGALAVRFLLDARASVRRSRRRTVLMQLRVGSALRWARIREVVEDERGGES